MTYFLIALGLVFTVGRELLTRKRFKRLEAKYTKLVNALNANADITEDLRAIINATGITNSVYDDKYIERINYMKTHLKAHRDDPKNHLYEPKEWLKEFEFAFQ